MLSHIDLRPLFYTLITLSLFGIWKLIEILIWLAMHVKIGVDIN